MQNEDAELPRKMNPLLFFGIVLAILVLVGFVGYQFFYRNWMPDRLARQGHALVEEGDYRTAALKVRRALQMNPRNVAGHRVMAEINEASASPQAVMWRQRVVDLEPGSVEDRVDLIAAALAFGEPRIAQHAFEGFEDEAKDSAGFYSAAGAMAMAAENRKLAIENYARAVERAPENQDYAFDLAAARLGSDDLAVRRKGLERLESLAALPEYRLRAGRLIVEDLISRELLTEASRRASELARDPDAAFSDRLRSVELLRRLGDLGYVQELNRLEKRAAGDPAEAGTLLASLVFAGLPGEALAWGKTLPEEMREQPIVNAPLALAYAGSGDIKSAEALAKKSQWGKFEYLRHAILAKAMQESGNEPGFRAEWNLAVSAAGKEPGALIELSRLTVQWGWKRELRELWWPIARGTDRAAADWALKSLYKEYYEAGNTEGLLSVIDRMVELSPEDPALLNNRAMLLLLLNRKGVQALGVARSLHEGSPSDPNYASTYAFALYREGRIEEALGVMKALPEGDLQEPAVAGYYGLLLKAKGQTAEAVPFFESAKKAPLLPEEEALFRKAEASGN
jgi:tetratricopeptide (TPR) repeat protein